MRDWWPVAVVAAIFVVLCLAFSSATPYRQGGLIVHGVRAVVPDIGAPDERQHANYVARLVRGEGFPVLVAGAPDAYENYQAHQPPAYYVLAAGWCKVTGADPQSPSGGGTLRFLNTLIGLATLLAVYQGARWAGCTREVGWASAAFLLMPMSVALHSAASNDPLLYCLCTWVLALLFRGLMSGFDARTTWAVGILTGAALLTKTTAVALMPCVLLAGAWAWSDGRKSEGAAGPARSALSSGLMLILPMVAAGPWWLRNLGLYGDPFAMKAFNEAFTGSPQAAVFIGGLGAGTYWLNMVLWWTARSSVGVFGYMDVFMFEHLNMEKSSAIYAALLVLLALPVGAGIGRALVARRSGRSRVVLLALLFSGAVVVLFVSFNAKYFQGQARYLYPAFGVFAWCAGAGACALAKGMRPWAWTVTVILLTVLDAACWIQLGPAFALRTNV